MKGRNLKLLLAGALGMALASPAMAGTCDDDLASVQAALQGPESMTTSPSDLTEAENLESEAAALCADGQIDQATEALLRAKKLLSMNN